MIDLLKVQLSTFVLKMTVLLTEIKQVSQGIAVGGAVASWLVRSSPDRAVRVRALALCCVLGQDTLLSQCLSPPRCINGHRRA